MRVDFKLAFFLRVENDLPADLPPGDSHPGIGNDSVMIATALIDERTAKFAGERLIDFVD